MHWLDWSVLGFTLAFIVIYGIWKTRKHSSYEDYLTGSRSTPWWAVGLSIMATQASAITFISTPGKGFESGFEFVQFYYGLPIAMFIIGMWFAPRFFHLKVLTAYEFLEKRFDLNTRLFTASLFLIQRGLAAGATIFAPSIILSKVLGWDLLPNIWIIGVLVILYTVSGGTKAVTQTHKQQMAVIFIGLFAAFFFLVQYINAKSSVSSVLNLADSHGMLQAFDFDFDLNNRYNVWSGLIGGSFLMLSYFGTDQSQVQRYLGGKSLSEIRIGLAFNGILKIPMQFFILFIGILVFGFYTLYERPVTFSKEKEGWLTEQEALHYKSFQAKQDYINSKKKDAALSQSEMESILLQQKALDRRLEEFSESRRVYLQSRRSRLRIYYLDSGLVTCWTHRTPFGSHFLGCHVQHCCRVKRIGNYKYGRLLWQVEEENEG